MTWSQVVERDVRECGLKREDVKDRERWRLLKDNCDVFGSTD